MTRGRRLNNNTRGGYRSTASSLSSSSSSLSYQKLSTTSSGTTTKNCRGRRITSSVSMYNKKHAHGGGGPSSSVSVAQQSEEASPQAAAGNSSWEGLKVVELKEELKKRNLPVGGRKGDLIKRLNDSNTASPSTSNCNANQTRKGKPVEWKTSLPKAYLLRSLMDDKSPFHSMSADAIYNSWHGFRDYPISNFKTNLKNLREAVIQRQKIIKEDERIFQLEKNLFPRKERTTTGCLYWDTHPANALLHEDVKCGLASSLKPIKLRATKNEYQDFSVGLFCGHVQQEKRAQREKPYWIPKRNKDALAKYNEEVEVLKSEFDTRHFNDELEEMNGLFGNMGLKSSTCSEE